MIKQIVKSHIIAAGSAAATYETRVDLGTEVKKVIGYYVQVVNNGSVVPETCKVSFANSSKTVFEPVGLGHLIVSSSVAIKDRFFREEPFNVDGYLNSKLTIPTPVGIVPMEIQYVLLVETNN
jgi:hypothetical protein